MTAVLFAALSGLSYGAADFSGAVASKRNNAALITLAMQIVSLVSLVVILLWFAGGEFVLEDMWWGALGGVGAAVGLALLYKALADGPMSTAASTTALTGSLVPVTVGLLIGEVPNAMTLTGVSLAIPATVLVSVGAIAVATAGARVTPRERMAIKEHTANTRLLSIFSGFGFGLFFIALAQTSAEGGLYPLLGARVASIVVLGAVLSGTHAWGTIARRDWPAVCVAGVLDCAANSFYLLALDSGSFTWVAAVSSLYPVATVLLARVILHERISPLQSIGLGLAGGALVLVGIGAT